MPPGREAFSGGGVSASRLSPLARGVWAKDTWVPVSEDLRQPCPFVCVFVLDVTPQWSLWAEFCELSFETDSQQQMKSWTACRVTGWWRGGQERQSTPRFLGASLACLSAHWLFSVAHVKRAYV